MKFSRIFGKTRRQLRKELEAMRQASRALAHNLNNSFTGVMGNVDMIRATSTDQESVGLAEDAFGSVERMGQILQAVLQTKISMEKVDLGKLVGEVLKDLGVTDTTADITYDDNMPTIVTDYAGLYQIIQNLITNAIKFSLGRPVVHVSAREEDGHILFSVRDAGIGVPKEKLKDIFKEGEHNQQYKGFGIGLASCRQIIDANGGKIWAESAGADEGTTVYFTLPIVK